jgi:hypothetical protein
LSGDPELVLAAKALGEAAHLMWSNCPDAAKVALCGAAVTVSGRVFYWIGQVACKDCRDKYDEIAEKIEETYDE